MSLLCTQAMAVDWIGNAYIALDVAGGGEVLYDAYNDGSSSGWTGTTDLQGLNVAITQGNSVLIGGLVAGSTNGGNGDPWAASFYHSVGLTANDAFSAGYTIQGLLFSNDDGNKVWDSNGGTAGVGTPTEIGSGLAVGTHIVSIYFDMNDNANFLQLGLANGTSTADLFENYDEGGIPAATGANSDPFTFTLTVSAASLSAPEPSSFALLALGGVFLARCRKKKLS